MTAMQGIIRIHRTLHATHLQLARQATDRAYAFRLLRAAAESRHIITLAKAADATP